MKISPLTGPLTIQADTNSSASQASARAKAISMITGSQPTQSPVQNPTQIAPEEMSAVSTPTQEAPTPEVKQTTGQSNTSDAPQASTEATDPKEAPLSSKYVQLARQEKAIRAKAVAVKAQEAALKSREDAIKAKEAEMISQYIPKDKLAKDPLKVLQEQGYTPDQITQMLLNAPDPATQAQQSAMDELRAEIKALKDGQESAKKTTQESQQQAYQQAIKQLKADTNQLVTLEPEAYQVIKATNSMDDVVDLITKTFEKDGVLLSVEEAATAVEDYLVEEAEKIAKIAKIQKRLAPKAPAATQEAAQPKQVTKPVDQKAKSPTLTNTMGSTRPLTARERALMAFKGELK